MSVVTLEQETLVVMSELADEEISEIVGGSYGYYESPDVSSKTKVGVKVKGTNVIVTTQIGNAVAIGGGDAVVKQNSDSTINNSKNKVITFGGYSY
ncbi:hypothetical protein NIES2100_67390 [Calothrix sp. NIES-2100]|uniref:hypothetical protein n=1 Tax=Calothrix sp. NIES-2100 TaxID=1954172 RepID=UPI000B5E0FA9|nr:hypothetical protein NIES2100_67390 [Calothrix sp. NIES-2100]